MEEKFGMPRPRVAKPSPAAGSGSSAVAVGKGVLHVLCPAMWLLGQLPSGWFLVRETWGHCFS